MNTLKKKPLVSIVLATYNGEKFLRKQLDSIINQSYKNVEIIVIDDCSADNTINILNEYATGYANFTVIQNEKNLGFKKNFEKGFTFANGDYLAPCDQDDIWMANKIEVLLNNIGDHAMVYANSAFIDSDDQLMGDKLSDTRILSDFNNPLVYIVGSALHGHAMLLSKQLAIEAMPFPNLLEHDSWLGFVATLESSVKFIDEVLVYYRRHNTNIYNTVHRKKKVIQTESQRMKERLERLQTMYEKCPEHLPEKIIFAQLCKCYESYSFKNNYLRMRLFFKHRHHLLQQKKHSELHRRLYCLKVFFKMV